MAGHEWSVFVRAPDFSIVSQVEYTKLSSKLRFNNLSTWALDLPVSPVAVQLRQPNWGIRIDRDDTTVVSGNMKQAQTKSTIDGDVMTITGVDDTTVLVDNLARPEPGTVEPPYSVNAYDTRSGIGSTVMRAYVDANIGPSAASGWAVPALTIGADPVVGSSVSMDARWTPLYDVLHSLAISAGGLGFRVLQIGTGLQFQVWQPADHSADIVFGRGLDNLGDYSYTQTRPTANYIVCGGGGELTARVIRENWDSASLTAWGRVTMFRDRRDTTDTTLMDQTIDEELVKGAALTAVTADLLSLPGRAWPGDFGLGDQVTVVIEDEPIVDIVQQISIDVSGSDGEVIIPRIGSPDVDLSPAGWFDRLLTRQAQQAVRIGNLERR
jgi:hypothetical protein